MNTANHANGLKIIDHQGSELLPAQSMYLGLQASPCSEVKNNSSAILIFSIREELTFCPGLLVVA